MTQSSEQLDLFTHGQPDEPLTAYQMLIASINGVKYPGQLKHVATGPNRVRAVLKGEMSEAEAQAVYEAKLAKKAALTIKTSAEQRSAEDADVPEFLHHPPMPTVELEQSEPYVPDHSNLQPREFDARERAAGEHLDR